MDTKKYTLDEVKAMSDRELLAAAATKWSPVSLDDRARESILGNGYWGTCVDCPRDVQGHAYPERCTSGRVNQHNYFGMLYGMFIMGHQVYSKSMLMGYLLFDE